MFIAPESPIYAVSPDGDDRHQKGPQRHQKVTIVTNINRISLPERLMPRLFTPGLKAERQ
jgi:hypothetical protein